MQRIGSINTPLKFTYRIFGELRNRPDERGGEFHQVCDGHPVRIGPTDP